MADNDPFTGPAGLARMAGSCRPSEADAVGLGMRTYECDVHPAWIDINDHMNAQFYGIVVYRAHAAFTDFLGMGDEYVRQTRCGKVVVQMAMSYEREVRRGARLAVDSWLLGVDSKRLHFFHELRNITDSTRVAVAEQLDLHVDLETRRTTPMPADLLARLSRFAAGQRKAGRPDGVGRTIRVQSAGSRR